ncbi:MAG TPA: hypothetical protein PKZ75_11430 [Bacteroidia bacterium]|nr:hypothetical protein [Bacteroidia bacterium]
MKSSAFLIVILLALFSCKKETITPPEPLPPLNYVDTNGFLEIHVDNVVNGAPLALSTTTYVNSNLDTFSVDIFKYYISNVQLVSATGFTYTEVESYYLVNEADPNSMHLMVKNVPPGQYSSIKFLIGVDSVRNFSGAQLGALDPVNDMFWNWNTGYIMAKMEGHSPQSTQPTKKIVYHIGGYGGKFKGIRNVSLSFPNNAIISKVHTPVLNLNADLYTWFLSPNFSDFNTVSAITGIGADSKGIADNYATMFSVTSVVN